MKKKILVLSIVFILCGLMQTHALTFKFASLLPEGTEWDRTLKNMASEWSDISDGKVKIKIYPGGIAGGEADVIRKMRIGQIDMAILTAVGMTTIYPDIFAINMPFLLESEEELDFIIEEVTPKFDESIQEKGFVVLAWSKSGWVNIFADEKVISPDDLAKLKFAGSVTQPQLTDAFKKMGFNVIPVDTPDMLMGLQSGMVNACYAPPMAAASYQWFGLAEHMLDMRIAPVIGGIVITERAWRKIPDKYKEELIESTKKMASDFYDEAINLEKKATDVMLANGLIIHSASPAVRKEWRALMGDNFSIMVGDGGFVSKESFEIIESMLEEFRSR
ncbi:MAG: TRAP transporter substrate-binding protein DctP [Spirochaetales bacterium]|nr:TRAP transporter substrate-binding protein DctP [Spirochaetales bacterium]